MKNEKTTEEGKLSDVSTCSVDSESRTCACGCGLVLIKPKSTSKSHFRKQRYIKGHHYAHDQIKQKQVEKLKSAHQRGAFKDGCEKRKKETLAKRAKCKCGCGQPVRASKAKYAAGCFDATTPENQAKAIAARDMDKLKAENSVRMTDNMKKWKDSGQLNKMRTKAKNAKGMKDHLAAKVWMIRDPFGEAHIFSNLSEWARNNTHRFKDDYPDSISSFHRRIAGGVRDLIKKNGKSCSYKGWTIVSRMELDAGGRDLLGRQYFEPSTMDD
jgi:hypothetical protein